MCNGPFLGLHIGDIPSLLGERIWRFLQGMKEPPDSFSKKK